jgi:hypothetical protein
MSNRYEILQQFIGLARQYYIYLNIQIQLNENLLFKLQKETRHSEITKSHYSHD